MTEGSLAIGTKLPPVLAEQRFNGQGPVAFEFPCSGKAFGFVDAPHVTRPIYTQPVQPTQTVVTE